MTWFSTTAYMFANVESFAVAVSYKQQIIIGIAFTKTLQTLRHVRQWKSNRFELWFCRSYYVLWTCRLIGNNFSRAFSWFSRNYNFTCENRIRTFSVIIMEWYWIGSPKCVFRVSSKYSKSLDQIIDFSEKFGCAFFSSFSENRKQYQQNHSNFSVSMSFYFSFKVRFECHPPRKANLDSANKTEKMKKKTRQKILKSIKVIAYFALVAIKLSFISIYSTDQFGLNPTTKNRSRFIRWAEVNIINFKLVLIMWHNNDIISFFAYKFYNIERNSFFFHDIFCDKQI